MSDSTEMHSGITSNCRSKNLIMLQPMLGDTKRGVFGDGDDNDVEADVEYYRLRSFSITANGVFNLGDSLKSRRSKSINSVTSSGTSCSSTRDARLLR